MKTGQRSLLLAFAMVAAANTASAQDARCYSFSREGVRDYKGPHVDLFSYEKVKHWIASSQFQSFDAADQAAQEIAIAPALFEIQFGEADAKGRFQQWRNDFLSSDFSQIADNEEQRSRLRTVSDALVKAFDTCMSNSRGTSAWIDASSDTDFAIFFAFHPPPGVRSSEVRVTSLSVGNARCPNLQAIRRIGSTGNVQCTKVSPQATAAVALSTDPFPPRDQPRFSELKPPASSMAYSLAGTIDATAIKTSQHSLKFAFPGTPTAADLGRARVNEILSWRTAVEKDIHEYDYVLNPQISPTSGGPFNSCSISNTSAEKAGRKLRVVVDAQCRMGDQAFRIFELQKQMLRDDGFPLSAEIILDRRLPVNAGSKPVFEPNSRRGSWSFRYDLPRDQELVWSYNFDLSVITGGGGPTYRLFRSRDGKEQRLTAGPFRAVVGDDQVLTIYRAPGANLDVTSTVVRF
jgi:hypothetical protein